MKKYLSLLLSTLILVPQMVGAIPLVPQQGGLGTSTPPSLNQLLIGNSSGGYNFTSTSSLGITQDLSSYVTFPYASSTYYFATNPLNFITSGYASSTFNTFLYASSTFPSFSYASSTYYLATNPSNFLSSVLTNTSLTGAGTSTSLLGINLAHANTWTGQPTWQTLGQNYTYVTAPTTSATGTLAGVGAGNVDNGTHSLQVAFVNASGETELGPRSNAINVVDKTVNGKISWTNIATSTDPSVTARNLYRTGAGNGNSTYFLATINDNTTTTYTDNIADNSLGQRSYRPNNFGLSQGINVSAGNMLLGSTNVRISREGLIQIPGASGNTINGLWIGAQGGSVGGSSIRIFQNQVTPYTWDTGINGTNVPSQMNMGFLTDGSNAFQIAASGNPATPIYLSSSNNSVSSVLKFVRGAALPTGWLDWTDQGTGTLDNNFVRFNPTSWTGSNGGINRLLALGGGGRGGGVFSLAQGGASNAFSLLDIQAQMTFSGSGVSVGSDNTNNFINVQVNNETPFRISDFNQLGLGVGTNLSTLTVRGRWTQDTFTVSTSTNFFTNVNHYLLNDASVVVFSTGSLPSPLTANTIYYVVNTSSLTYQLSTTKGGSPVTLTTTGTGTHTVQLAVRGTTTASSTTAITGSGSGDQNPNYPYEVGIGDIVSLSSAVGTNAMVVSTGGSGTPNVMTLDTALGNGTTQSVVINRAIARFDDQFGTTKLFIDPFGNVGLGILKPTAKLNIVASVNAVPLLIASSTGSLLNEVTGAGHIITGGGTPILSSCGGSPSIVGNDTSGQITFGTGALLTSCTVTFSAPMETGANNKVHVFVNQDSGALGIFAAQSVTTTGFNITTALSGATGDTVSYNVVISN